MPLRESLPLIGIIASEKFGSKVFNRGVMKRMLPKEVYKNIIDTIEGREKIHPKNADIIAGALKEWALSHGATHFTHWFQPLTGLSAEKHDAFIDWNTSDAVIEKFSGKELVQGEPDASSFPSGGLRNTYEARGYTGWDPSTPPFIWKGGEGTTLCIPSVFFSWNGEALDTKIPLLRSDQKMNTAVMRLLKMTGSKATRVFSTVGCEQEYFVIDRHYRELRPDLVMLGKTVFGASPPKGQELQDHYFGAVKDRVLSFMHDFEQKAIELGIPVKTRHNEVAPAQHEVAPVFEKATLAVDHNIIMMELLRKTAFNHGLSCLLHEKPFAELNGSGKHTNWSLSTDTGENLFLPPKDDKHSFRFLILLTAVVHGIYKHGDLLRASIGSASNDYRLGGHEAPPAIISVYLGDELETLLDNIEKHGSHTPAKALSEYNLGIANLPTLERENTDRNRTSPFAFTGNKFEFRAVGSSTNISFPITCLNIAFAESLNLILDAIEKEKGKSKEDLGKIAIPIIRKFLKESKPIRFTGDNYSKEWVAEAKKRKLPNEQKSFPAFKALIQKHSLQAFEGVLSARELESRYEVACETYANLINIEANLMIDLFQAHILPAALEHQKGMAESLESVFRVSKVRQPFLKEKLKFFAEVVEEAATLCEELEQARVKASALVGEKKGKAYCEDVAPLFEPLRTLVDCIEKEVDDRLWVLPKYREMLFLV